MFITKNKSIIALSLLLSLSIASSVFGANDLNKVDIKRSSTSASTLNVTIYTANPYDENVAVTKKSDNNYVILMPNISGVNASNIDYSAIKDIVSDVSLRSVDDSVNGYTKITLTTTKPVTITTTSKKSTPLTDEQKAYKNLIAQSRNYSQAKTSSADSKSQQAQKNVSAASSQQVANVSEKKPVEKKANMIFTVSSSDKQKVETKATPVVDKKQEPKVENTKVAAAKSSIEQKKQEKLAVNAAAPIIPKAKTLPENDTLVDDTFSLAELKKEFDEENKADNKELTNKIEGNQVADATSMSVAQSVDNLASNDNKGTEKNMLTTIIILLSSMIGLIAFSKGIKNSLEGSVVLKKSFKDNLHEMPPEPIADYSEITSDSNLSWQEKYQKYINSVVEINPDDGVLKHVGNGEYEFVNSAELESIYKDNYEVGYGESANIFSQSAQLQPQEEPKFKSYNRPALNSSPDSVPPIRKVKNQSLKHETTPKLQAVKKEQRFESYKDLANALERTLHNSPDVERTNLNEDVLLKQIEKAEVSSVSNAQVYKEEDSISQSIRKSPKLKSFDQKLALEQTKRNAPMPKSRIDIIKSKNLESRHVNLENSGLYSSPRKFANANLSSADLINKNKINQTRNIMPNSNSNQFKKTGYSTISIDEFFDVMDSSSKYTAPATLASRVADNLGKMTHVEAAVKNEQKPESKTNILEGKIIKEGYNIDSNTGFYIISDGNGKNSLIGKVNNEVTVLKDFPSYVDSKLQVRKDSENVYMVRAAHERYLVEINGNKMGILLEL